jgi:hypothetical protein
MMACLPIRATLATRQLWQIRATIPRMVADVLTTWGVVLELEGKAAEVDPDSTSRWLAESRDAYFMLCPRLAAFLQDEKAELQLTDEYVDPLDDTSSTGGLKIGASVIEVRPSSFEMAIRVRRLGDDPAPPANGRCTLVVRRRSTGERIPSRVRSATSSSRFS